MSADKQSQKGIYVNCMFIIALVFSVLSLNNRVAISVRYTIDVKMAIWENSSIKIEVSH